MDIFFNNSQNAYRAEIRGWLSDNLPEDLRPGPGQWPRLSEEEEKNFLIEWERRVYAAGDLGALRGRSNMVGRASIISTISSSTKSSDGPRRPKASTPSAANSSLRLS